MILIQTTLLYMLAALVLPDFDADRTVDLRAHYYREARPFFAILIATLGASLLKDVVLDGHLPAPENIAFHGGFAGVAAIAIISRRPRLHEVLAVLSAALIVAYIATLFTRLD